ncbi:MAG: LPP20 family lipoprotein [Deltaproteobacteria bacterium]|nr:LPP20 family lipoprotein [Deltaproteobacteria bacterium]
MRPLVSRKAGVIQWMILGLVGSAVCLASPAMAACTEEGEDNCIDWEKGVAYAVGTGAPAPWLKDPGQKNISARRAAKLDAARNLLELIKGTQVSSSTTLENRMASSDSVRVSVEGRLQNLRVVGKEKYFSDGTIQVRVAASLREVVPADALMDNTPPAAWKDPSRVKGDVDTSQTYTGLVIDARGLELIPAMSPRVVDPSGQEVYSAAFVTREYAVNQGVVGYAKKLEKATASERVKGNPLVIKAKASTGQTRTDLVLEAADADALRRLAQTQNFMRECRVIFLLD